MIALQGWWLASRRTHREGCSRVHACAGGKAGRQVLMHIRPQTRWSFAGILYRASMSETHADLSDGLTPQSLTLPLSDLGHLFMFVLALRYLNMHGLAGSATSVINIP